MKKAFSLLELIFAIVVISIIASFAIPKYINTKNNALASTIKRDLISTITSIQSYYLINNEIKKISDAIRLNEVNWNINDKKIVFKDKKQECLSLELKDSSIIIKINPSKGKVCEILDKMGVKSEVFDLI